MFSLNQTSTIEAVDVSFLCQLSGDQVWGVGKREMVESEVSISKSIAKNSRAHAMIPCPTHQDKSNQQVSLNLINKLMAFGKLAGFLPSLLSHSMKMKLLCRDH